jgi:hypothetical protein
MTKAGSGRNSMHKNLGKEDINGVAMILLGIFIAVMFALAFCEFKSDRWQINPPPVTERERA